VAGVRVVALTVTEFALGVLGLALFRWTPTTGKGILVYVLLFAVAVGAAIALSKDKKTEG